ncbi:glycoside hydrolase family 15 protein [Propionicimonas sp.]|uniref:glycoside hydrolase family 15 protein n=1 Tax=Propionicimonas sp. TaxID=1955623 RepID=UPI0039E68F6D
MSVPIEDYGLLSSARTAALVSREGSIDWLCVPRFDSPSVFGALLGDADHGRWSLRPAESDAVPSRRYDGDSFILVTRWDTGTGTAQVHDFLVAHERCDLVRRIVGLRGRVEFDTALTMRFDYARALPWVRQVGDADRPALRAIAGPQALLVRGVALSPENHSHRGRITVSAGESVDLTLTGFASHLPDPGPLDVDAALARTRRHWQEWAVRVDHSGPYHDQVVRSLLVLRALSHRDTGGIVAAPTTSLPEELGGVRNWDYRYVWLRDAALTLEALVAHGFLGIAGRWREWLLRAVAGQPAQIQILYGIAGERDLVERELPALPGYAGSAPVRIGNAAVGQYQADVAGEVLVALEAARRAGLGEDVSSWSLQRGILDHLLTQLDRPDRGIWEIRGEPRHFTHSRVMMWAAFDRGVRAVEEGGLPGDPHDWAAARDQLAAEVARHGVVDGHFVQAYGADEADAALLLLPTVGFCAPDDPRILATVERVERDLMPEGLVLRYRPATGVDGVPGPESPFLACSFWLVQQYAMSGRTGDAHALMARACACANDLGLLSEEYDARAGHQLGNTPQALTHLALVQAADAINGHGGRAAHRRG